VNPASRKRLTLRSVDQFKTETLFDRIARAVCEAECLPRKELYEAWEVARRTRRRFRGGRVVDLACGHGLLAQLLLILDDTSRQAIAVDTRLPKSAAPVAAAMAGRFPRIEGRVQLIESPLEANAIEQSDLVVSCHACGALTDTVLERASAVGARIAVLPCCHDIATSDRGGLEGWLDGPLAIDVMRAATLRVRGYTVHTQEIPVAITPKNRLLLGAIEDR
jgi:SAM-dependent methyltransferase